MNRKFELILVRCRYYLIPVLFVSLLFSGCKSQSKEPEQQIYVKRSFISDFSKHEANQQILGAILEEEIDLLNAKRSVDKAHDLAKRISQIAEALSAKGFSIDAYQIPDIDQNSIVSFNHFVLWEGGQNRNESIPLTFFVYVWPSKELAQKYYKDSWNSYYGTEIHSHPIACAFALLEGTLIERSYELIDPAKRKVQLIHEERFEKFEGSIDDLNQSFIHQVYSKANGKAFAVSLHAYGLPTEKQVVEAFEENSHLHTYTDAATNGVN